MVNATPRFSIVLPATGTHAWDITEGWVKALEESKLLNHVFRPRANWGDNSLLFDDNLSVYLQEDPCDYVILLGIDWHSQPMHHGSLFELLRRRSAYNIGIIWEDYDIPSGLLGELKSQMMSSWLRASSLANIFITNHESNVNILAPLSCGYSIHYVGFGIDTNRYCIDSMSSIQRSNEIRFSGKIDAWADEHSEGPYALRRKILAFLKDSISELHICQGSMSEKEYKDFLMGAKACINLPSFSLSPTLRNYEALCAGTFLITWQGTNNLSSEELRKFPNALFYDPHNYKDIAEKCMLISRMRTEEYHDRVNAGVAMAHDLLSHRSRITAITEIIQQQNISHLRIGKRRTEKLLVVDMVFLQIACNGIAYVWDSIIQCYLELYGKDSVLLIRRTARLLRDYGCETIYFEPIDWNQSPELIARDNCDLLAKHGITDYTFASTYYTTAAGHYNAQIIHDMIPELLQADERIWHHKQCCLDYSDMLICVSFSTYIDLIGLDKGLAAKAHYIPNGLPLLRFAQADSEALAKAGERKRKTKADHSILYIGGRYGVMGYKNCSVLLHAFRRLCQRINGKYSAQLIFVSHAPSPEPQILPLMAGLPIEFITADDDELNEIYDECDCLVYSSAIEGFGLPILEGLYAGIHVVASDIPPHREASYGYWDEMTFFDPFSPEDLAEKLYDVMESRDQPGKHQGLKARKSAIEQTSYEHWRRFARKLNNAVFEDRYSKINQACGNSNMLSFASSQFLYKQQSLPKHLDSSWMSS
jgi:glycosyltransferase involved in cell wall biosynthesis